MNKILEKTSGGLLPPTDGAPKYLSVGGSHTNCFLRALKAGSKTPVAQLQNASGNLEMDRICQGQPQLREAANNGLKWTVISHHAVEACPKLAGFVQKALNTEAKEAVTEVEVIKRGIAFPPRGAAARVPARCSEWYQCGWLGR